MAYRQRDDLLSAALTDEQVIEMVQLRKAGRTLVQLASIFEVHKNTVRNILRRAKEQGIE